MNTHGFFSLFFVQSFRTQVKICGVICKAILVAWYPSSEIENDLPFEVMISDRSFVVVEKLCEQVETIKRT